VHLRSSDKIFMYVWGICSAIRKLVLLRNVVVYILFLSSVMVTLCVMLPTENNVEQPASKSRRHAKESDGINQIIRIHTDQHRAVLNDIDDAIQTVLETGELPLFENGKNRHLIVFSDVYLHNINFVCLQR